MCKGGLKQKGKKRERRKEKNEKKKNKREYLKKTRQLHALESKTRSETPNGKVMQNKKTKTIKKGSGLLLVFIDHPAGFPLPSLAPSFPLSLLCVLCCIMSVLLTLSASLSRIINNNNNNNNNN
jgi:hypothetical protein